MNSQLQSIIQNLLAVIGGFLVLKGIDAGVIGQVSGIVLGLISIGWAIAQKNVNGGAILAVVGNIVTFVGGLLIAQGKLSNTDLATYSGLIIGLATSILDALHINTTAVAAAKIASLTSALSAKTAQNGIVPKKS